jgi:hypothetical protein
LASSSNNPVKSLSFTLVQISVLTVYRVSAKYMLAIATI